MIRILETCKEDIQTEGKAKFAETNTDISFVFQVLKKGHGELAVSVSLVSLDIYHIKMK